MCYLQARLLSQIIGSGAQIIGRAFVEAYKEAAAAGRHSIEAGAKGAADAATRKTGITIEEAAQVLNVKKDSSVEDVVKRFEVMFKANDPKEGGSFYIQSKVVRARERFELEMTKKAAESGPTPNQ
ncbi:Pam16-domain-containing protein [Cladochytrium replicatum]|nr:Pam16-domain-containing protein [Cladochytrium replicatum]